MYFFGKAYDKESLELVSSSLVRSMGNLGMLELKKELSELFKRYNPVGLSIIIPENESYALQEANKDIDYISMGIPFIGNDRLPTYEKIARGMGTLDSNEELIEQLLNNSNGFYDHCVQACKREAPKYSIENFKRTLLATYNSVCA
jgi:glycosyltransferase involved in cell wall biosynthesis